MELKSRDNDAVALTFPYFYEISLHYAQRTGPFFIIMEIVHKVQ